VNDLKEKLKVRAVEVEVLKEMVQAAKR